jgi:hypothetical protein
VGRNIGECIEFARHRKNGSGTLILPSEYEVAYSEIKSCVNKSVFDIGGFSAKSV